MHDPSGPTPAYRAWPSCCTRARLARPLAALWLGIAAALLAGCASGPRPGPAAWSGRDGPEASPPPGLASVPDAEPRLEPIRNGGPNRPYEVLGRSYTPMTQDRPFAERGLASWYGRKFHGRRTANGEVYDMYAMTAAHPTLPLPSYVRVRNPANGRAVVLRVNDRGPFHAGRIVDLSYTAALKLDLLRGVAPVELERITSEDIRTGAWRRGAAPVVVASADPVRPEPVLRQAQDDRNSTSVRPEPVEGPVDKLRANGDAAAMPEPTAQSEEAAAPARPLATAPRGFWIQLGAFRQRDGAEGFQRRVQADLDWLSPLLAVFSDAALFRLQAGPYPSRDEARASAERVREALQLVPVIVERR